jgi:hypothetical protein
MAAASTTICWLGLWLSGVAGAFIGQVLQGDETAQGAARKIRLQAGRRAAERMAAGGVWQITLPYAGIIRVRFEG